MIKNNIYFARWNFNKCLQAINNAGERTGRFA